MEETFSFIPLLIVIFLALLVPLILSRFKRLRLPIVVGEIIAGIIIGRSGFQLVHEGDPVLDLLAEFGFAFLFFLGGLEIDFSNLEFSRNSRSGRNGLISRLKSPLPIGIFIFICTLMLSFLVALGLVPVTNVNNVWILTLILAPSSLGIIFAVLKENGYNTGRYGQTLLVSAIIADFGTVFLLTVLVAALSTGLTLEILLIGLIFIAFLLLYRFSGFLQRIWPVRRTLEELSSATSQIKIRVAFAILLAFVVLAEVVGAELVLGAFLAGAMLSLLSGPEDTEALHQLEAIGFGFFIPIFFIMVGVNFNGRVLFESPEALIVVPILLIAAFAVKILPSFSFRLLFGWQETIAAGFLLSSRLSLIIAEAAIALDLGLIDEALNAEIILVAMILATIAPLIFIRLAPERNLDEEPAGYVIAGARALGIRVAEHIREHREKVVIIDPDAERISLARGQGHNVVLAFTDRPDERATVHLDQAHTFISTDSSDDINYLNCKTARTFYGIDNVFTQVTDPSFLSRYEQLGVKTLSPTLDQGAFLGLLARNPSFYTLLTRTDDNKEVYEVYLRNAEFDGRSIRNISFPGDVHVLAVQRDGEIILPMGDTQLQQGDRITLAGTLDCLDEALRMFAVH
jgi:Kef-type K+ transport system membrane component KefB